MSKCPLDTFLNQLLPDNTTFRSNNIHQMTSLPWTSLYSQTGSTGTGTGFTSGDSDPELSLMYTYAMALTVLFTVSVFTLEHMLDHRQERSYKITTFPKMLQNTVSKIDSESALAKAKKDDGDGDSASASASNGNKQQEEKKEKGTEGEKEDETKDVDRDKPILPQLQEKFIKAQSYGMDKIQFGMFSSVYELLETLLFLFCGFLPYIWDKSVEIGESYFGYTEEENEVKVSLIFLLVTTLIGTVTSLPFELYSTFRIEKKHGFNKQTPMLFFTDKIKSLFLTFVIGGPFVAILLKIIKWGGEHFYIYVWGFMFVFSVLMMTLVPVVIMPMFNKYEPLPESNLKTRIYALAERIKYPLNKLFVMDGSKRSSHSNAFMFGFGKNKRIVLFDTLMEQVSDDEILAILGHELGHWKLGHTWSNFVVTQLYTAASFYSFSLCYNSVDLYRAFGFDGVDRPIPTIIAMMLFFQTIWAPVDKLLSFVMTIFSRSNEFAADRFSANLGMGKTLQTGLCKISLENLGAMCPDPWYATYHYSHPPLVERLSAMMEFEKKAN